MHIVYVSDENVKQRFIDKHDNMSWDQDSDEYLEQEMKIRKEY